MRKRLGGFSTRETFASRSRSARKLQLVFAEICWSAIDLFHSH